MIHRKLSSKRKNWSIVLKTEAVRHWPHREIIVTAVSLTSTVEKIEASMYF